jgi:hypothetical protein
MAPGLPLPRLQRQQLQNGTVFGWLLYPAPSASALSAAGALALRVVSFDNGIATVQVNVGQNSTTLAVPLAV